MKQSFITITGIGKELLISNIDEFTNLYPDQNFVQDIKLYKKDDMFLMLFTNSPDFMYFSFAVNYLHYIQTNNAQLPKVYGYFYNETNEYDFLTQGFVKLYVSANDQDYDNVSVVNNLNETYVYDFGEHVEKVTEQAERYEIADIEVENFTHVLNISPQPVEQKPWWKFW
jgi:hypothetical protein